MLVIGCNVEQAAWLAEELAEHHYFVKAVLGETDAASVERATDNVDAVAITEGVANRSAIIAICERIGRSVLLVPDTVDLLLHSARTTRINDLLLYEAREPGLTSLQKTVKRIADILFALSIAPIAAPLMLAIAALIRVCSPGPILFRQERVGRNGRTFDVLKFRTMRPRAEDSTGPVLATDDDPRATTIGRVLRATHLDEFPQLINVLRGEMSVVGPRPERPCFTREFERNIPHYELRRLVKPGITGLAQVQGNYKTSAAGKLRFDLTYILNYSPLLDLKILVLTITKLFEGLVPKRRDSALLPIAYQHRCPLGH